MFQIEERKFLFSLSEPVIPSYFQFHYMERKNTFANIISLEHNIEVLCFFSIFKCPNKLVKILMVYTCCVKLKNLIIFFLIFCTISSQSG